MESIICLQIFTIKNDNQEHLTDSRESLLRVKNKLTDFDEEQ